MKLALVGPELEENLALRYIHAAAAKAGHETAIFDFHNEGQIPQLASSIRAWGPQVVGMSMVFTARAREYLCLARQLRQGGFGGYITAGGHFASFHAEQLLADAPAIDSVLHGEGEEAMVDLLANLSEPQRVAGLTYRQADGRIDTTEGRRPPDDLDSRAWPSRPEVFHEYLGQPVANMISGRGCFGNCHFCSINAWHRRTRGKRFRQRCVRSVVQEMAGLYHERGVRIFNFHDDNFFLPNKEQNLRRFEEFRRELRDAHLGRIAIQIKARPDSVEEETIALLKEIGLFRVFLGVESNAVAGLKALGRGIGREQNGIALDLLKAADLHVTFNLLMFEPDCTLADLHDNVDFIRRHAEVPLNFCRVEVYGGTALERRMKEQGRLIGDYFGYTYRISHEESQLAYELFRAVFSPRNFLATGMNIQTMSVDYNLHVLKHFFPHLASASLVRQAKDFVRRINRSNVELMEEVLDFAARRPLASPDQATEFARKLFVRRAKFDDKMAGRSMAIHAAIGAAHAKAADSVKIRIPRAASAAAAAALIVGTLGTGCGCDPPPPDRSLQRPAPAEPAEHRSISRPKVYGAYVSDVMPAQGADGRTSQTFLFDTQPSIGTQAPALWAEADQPQPPPPGGPEICEMAPPDLQPLTQPTTDQASQPATTQSTTQSTTQTSQPAVGPYTPEQTMRIQQYLQKEHGPRLSALAKSQRDFRVGIYLELDSRGQVRKYEIKQPARFDKKFIEGLEQQVVDWRVKDLPRAGSCELLLECSGQVPPIDVGTHMCEMAPAHPGFRAPPLNVPPLGQVVVVDPPPPDLRPDATSEPTSQPTTTQSTTQSTTQTSQPAVEAYTLEQTRRIQQYLQKEYGPKLAELAKTQRLPIVRVAVYVELNSRGQVQKYEVKQAARFDKKFVEGLEQQIVDWRVPDLSRPGSCELLLECRRQIGPGDGGIRPPIVDPPPPHLR